MNESNSEAEKPKAQPRSSQEQYEMLKRCSDRRDMTEWNEWRKNNSNEPILLERANLNGFYLQGANLRGAKQQKTILWEARLKKANLREADLQEAQLIRACLEGTEFGGAKLQGADFSRAIVDGRTLIWRCKVDRKTKFEGVVLDAARIYPATRQLLEYNVRRMNWEAWYQYKNWQDNTDERHVVVQKLMWFIRLFWSFSDYGRSTGRIAAWFLGFAIVFAAIYYLWGLIAPPGIVDYLFVDPSGVKVGCGLALLRAIHFSVVIMTVGFTNMHANAHSFWAHILVGFQMILGFVLLGALVTRFAVLFTAGGPAGRFADDK